MYKCVLEVGGDWGSIESRGGSRKDRRQNSFRNKHKKHINSDWVTVCHYGCNGDIRTCRQNVSDYQLTSVPIQDNSSITYKSAKKSFTAHTVAKWRVRKYIQSGPSPPPPPPTDVDSFVAAGGVTQHCLGEVRGG